MDVIGEAAYRIRADTAGFQSEAESGLVPAMKKVAGVLAAVFVAKKIFDFGKEAVTEAAKTQKAVESVRASFGKFGGDVVTFNENIAGSLGVSNQAASAFSSQIGTLTDNLGISNQQSSLMAINLEELGGNMAAIKGIDPAEVFNVLANSLAGSTRGLKQFGIVIGTADIAQRAFKLGLIDTVDDALTPAAKAQAIFSLEMDNFGEVAKRAGKNQDDLANITQRLSAQFDNIKERIGMFLLPVVADLASIVETQVIPFLSEWVDILQEKLGPTVDSIGGFLKAHADVILDVAKAFVVAATATVGLGSAIETLSLTMELITSPIGIILALGTALVLAYQKVQVFHDAVDSVANALLDVFGPAVEAVKDALGTITDAFEAAGNHKKFSVKVNIIWLGIKEAAGSLWDQFVQAWEGEESGARKPIMVRGKNIQFEDTMPAQPGWRERFESWVGDLHKLDIAGDILILLNDASEAILTGLNDLSEQLIAEFLDLTDVNVDWGGLFARLGAGFLDGVSQLESITRDAVAQWAGAWLDNVKEMFSGVSFGGLFDSLIGAVTEFIQTLIGDFNGLKALETLPQQIFNRMVGLAAGVLGEFAGRAGNMISNVASNIVGGLSNLPGRVGGIISNMASSALGKLQGLVSSAGAAAGNIASRIVSAFTNLPGQIAGKIAAVGSTILSKLQGAATSAFRAALSLGASIVQGIISGLSSLPGALASAIGGAVGDAVGGAWDRVKGSPPGPGEVAIREHITGPMLRAFVADIEAMAPQLSTAMGAALGGAMAAPGGSQLGFPAQSAGAASGAAGTVNQRTVSIGQVILPSVRNGDDLIRQLDAQVARLG